MTTKISTEPRSASRDMRRRLGTIVGLLAIVGAVAGIIVAVRGGDEPAGGTVDLAGDWTVVDIKTDASHHMAVPASFYASFNFDTENGYVGGYDGVSSYDCSYSRSGNTLSLFDCLVTGDVGGGLTDAQNAVVDAYDKAFGDSSMTVSADGPHRVLIQLGGVAFTASREK